MSKVILVSGKIEARKYQAEGYEPIDIVDPNWKELLAGREYEVSPAVDFSLKLNHKEAELKEEAEPKAALVNETVLVSDSYNSAQDRARAWLGKHHLELIEKLLGQGFEVRLLDENGQPI